MKITHTSTFIHVGEDFAPSADRLLEGVLVYLGDADWKNFDTTAIRFTTADQIDALVVALLEAKQLITQGKTA